MNFFHNFIPSPGYAVNKQKLTIEINLCLLRISACRHGNFLDVTSSLVDRTRQKKFNVHFESILVHEMILLVRYWTLILNRNVIFYLQRLFRVVWLVAAWETRWWIVSIVEESRILFILSWFGRRYWLRAGASSLRNSRSDGYSWTKRCRLTELWHFSFDGDDKSFTRCLISLENQNDSRIQSCVNWWRV